MKGTPLQSLVISLENVRKSYMGGFHLGPVDLEIEPGRIVAVVGPNGGGKSTLFGLLMNLLRPDSGTVNLFGLVHPRDEVAIKQRIGYVPERATGRDEMSARYVGDFVSYWYPNWDQGHYEDLLGRAHRPWSPP
jgi:ABC-2 type transport system ATP-binding protein